MTGRRDGERGLTLIEVIIVTTITALLGVLILPLLTQSAQNSKAVSERALDLLDEMRAEREFRTLVRAVTRRERDGQAELTLAGEASRLLMHPSLATIASCANAGAPIVALSIRSRALVCASEGRERALIAWGDNASGVFSYSEDGASWQSTWRNADAAPYVKFEVRQGARARIVWIERASSGAP
jgi:Tfp pilus assembly protein PilE